MNFEGVSSKLLITLSPNVIQNTQIQQTQYPVRTNFNTVLFYFVLRCILH